MIKIAAIGVGAALLAAWIKTIKSEYALWITLAAGAFLGLAAILKLDAIVSELKFLQGYFSAYGSYFKLLIKIIGITYLAEFSADLCKDAGANTLASQVEMFGKLSILVLCMPIMSSLLETVDYFLGG
ncbi:MAG: stage III sporulation AC/AD family protein [Lachnospiraceae bacterium]|nr:stage III sporulation AC/AD family protein [Lachnospiraceae bacterium]